MATRQHLSNQANQVGACCVLNECSDDPDPSASMVGKNVPLSKLTDQTPLTPTASAAVDIKKTGTFDVLAMGGNGEPWASETDHRTGTKSSRAERIVVCCMELFCEIIQNKLCLWPRQRVCLQTSLLDTKTLSNSIHCRTQNRRAASAGACPGGCKDFSHKGSNAHFIRCRSEGRTSSATTRPSFMFSTTHGS